MPWEPSPGSGSEHVNIGREEKGHHEHEESSKEHSSAETGDDTASEEDRKVQDNRRLMKMYIKAEDLEKYGRTPGCRGCRDEGKGKYRVAHNDQCRGRIAKLMEKDEEGRQKLQRERERQMRWTERLAE